MRVTDRNAFFAILGLVTVLGIAFAEYTHQRISMLGLLGGLAGVLVLFGAYMVAGALARRSWARASATVENTHVQYFRTVQYGDNWQVALTYSYHPQGGSAIAPIQGRETLQLHGRGQEMISEIEAQVKAGRRLVIEYDPNSPDRSRVVTKGETPVFDG